MNCMVQTLLRPIFGRLVHLLLRVLKAKGQTVIIGLQHWQRGYEALEQKLCQLGGVIRLQAADQIS